MLWQRDKLYQFRKVWRLAAKAPVDRWVRLSSNRCASSLPIPISVNISSKEVCIISVVNVEKHGKRYHKAFHIDCIESHAICPPAGYLMHFECLCLSRTIWGYVDALLGFRDFITFNFFVLSIRLLEAGSSLMYLYIHLPWAHLKAMQYQNIFTRTIAPYVALRVPSNVSMEVFSGISIALTSRLKCNLIFSGITFQ